MIKANHLSLGTKILAVLLVVTAAIVQITLDIRLIDHNINMANMVLAATFIAGSFLSVDISKIKQCPSGSANLGADKD